MENIIRFEAEKTYRMSWICDADLKTDITIIARTAKTVRIKFQNEVKSCRIKVLNNIECIDPSGNYSMSPRLYADRAAK